jgi:hypothetical protein
MFSQHLKKFIVGAVIGMATVAQAHAATIDLAPAASFTPFFHRNQGNERSIVVRDDSSVQITGFGVRMDPLVASFNLTAEIFAWNPTTNTRGALLRTATQGFTDAGLRFYDVAISEPLSSGQFYELNLKTFGLSRFDAEFFNFNGPLGGGSNTPYATGPVTVFDGCGNTAIGGCGNTTLLHFDMSVAAIPEPAEWTMLIAGLLFVGFIARRRKKFAE